MTRKALLDEATELLKARIALYSASDTGLLARWLDEIIRYMSRRHPWTFLKRSGTGAVSAASNVFDIVNEPIDVDRLIVQMTSFNRRLVYRERSELELMYYTTATGQPAYWSLKTKATADQKALTYQAEVWPPVPDQAYTIPYHGWFYLPKITGDNEENRWTRDMPYTIMDGMMWRGKLQLEGLAAAREFQMYFDNEDPAKPGSLQREIFTDMRRVVDDYDGLRPQLEGDDSLPRTLTQREEYGLYA